MESALSKIIDPAGREPNFSLYSVQIAEKRFLLRNERNATAIPQQRLNPANPQIIRSERVNIYLTTS
ncbi:hypothetical protein CIW68_03660 [Enterobacter cloacae]|nr:hypothetical protein CIW68_03660 [Enterobacter cloacae]